MSLTVGSRIGPYEITGAIGAGGMGEVFRARDTKLNRDVAIKVLPAEFAKDHERVARFKREAQILASLNHPNIAAIYGIEEGEGAIALAMELVEGEDLSAHIARGPMPLAEVLPIARQIAEALEAAHEQGIIHRDLKPANIRVRAERAGLPSGHGTVKVLDFGLARAMDPSGASNPNVSHSPTLTHQGTLAGMIVGTAAYMSPEQAKGKTVDKRADIWAFGVVLYEMLSGKRAFKGEDVSETLASVLKDTLSMDALPAATPKRLTRLIERCLDRDLKTRLRDIGEARVKIGRIEAGDSDSSSGSPGSRIAPTRSRLVAALVALAAILGIALAVSLVRRADFTAVEAPTVRFALFDGAKLKVATWVTTPFGASRDGNTVVFTADDGSGDRLWVRTLNQPDPRALADTEGAYQPAISPDGEWVAFVVANHVIRKCRLSGGGATTLTTTDDLTAALAWTSNDEIVFEKIGSASGIQRVSANGGAAQLLIPIDRAAGEQSQRRPLVLWDQRLVLYAGTFTDGIVRLVAFSLEDSRRARLDLEGIQALGMVDDHLVYARRDGVLMAVPFDVRGLRVSGTPRQLSDQVLSGTTGTAVTLSPAGTLVYSPPTSPLSRLMLGDATGNATPLGDAAKAYGSPRFSPDSRRIAVSIADSGSSDLWVLDRVSKEATRVTRGGNGTLDLQSWMPDGKAFLFTRHSQLWIVPVDGGAEPRRLVETAGEIQGASPMPDGRSLLVTRRLRNQGILELEELVRLPIDGAAPPVSVVPSRSSGGSIRPVDPRVSPDGLFVAFQGRNEQQVHVRALDGTATVQVSEASGVLPAWGRDSRTLFYQTSSGPMVAELQTSPPLSVLRRRLLPPFPSPGFVSDVSADGKTVLIVAPVDRSSRVLVVLNWTNEVRRQLRRQDAQP